MNTKQIFAILASIMCSVFINAQTEQNLALIITKSDGVIVGYNLTQFPVLSFENDMLNVSYDGIRNSFPWNEIATLSYVKDSDIQNNIRNFKKDNGYSVLFHDGGVSVSSNKSEMIKIYDVNGKCIYSTKIGVNNPLHIDFRIFTKGFYILSNGNNNTKFYVK